MAEVAPDADQLHRVRAVLPLLSFGTGAADAFAYMTLGGIFTANMTGNAVVAAMFTRARYTSILSGAVIAIMCFASALFLGFRIARSIASVEPGENATLLSLALSAAFLAMVVLLWCFTPHTPGALLSMIAASSAAMAFQTVATKHDGVPRGALTTFSTGTLSDLLQDIEAGSVPWRSTRWLPLAALPMGAATAAFLSLSWPEVIPLLPLCASLVSIGVIAVRPGRSGITDM